MKFPYARPLNIAHRGARSLAPENTLLAAQKGLDLRADLWELDVALTYDGEIVLIHDDTLERTSNAKKVYPNKMQWNVHLFSLAELRQLDFGSWFVEEDPFKQIAAGAVTEAEQQAMHNIQITTLREALEFTRTNNWYVNVEIKDLSGTRGDAVVAEKVVALIEELVMVDAVLISSFNHPYIMQVKQINPSIRTAALTEKVVADPLALLEQAGADAFNPGVRYIGDEAVIRKVRDTGYDVYVWTVNDEKTMRRLIDAGVSGIFTDFPQLLHQVLASYEP
jgi:glycerophosphoryl diester phosphodiesterase